MILSENVFADVASRLPRVSLGRFPTPVHRLHRLEQELGKEGIYVKRDDMSGESYGGNKVRKLEFLLGEAVEKGASLIVTFGCAGSNHALATAIYARKLGMKSMSMLLPQPRAHYVRKNLLMQFCSGASLHYYTSMNALNRGVALRKKALKFFSGRDPYVIPAGGTSLAGAVGFINAAFELKDQIDQGLMPEPDYLYVPLGTMGTATGLLLGLKAAGLRTRVIAVPVVDERFASEDKLIDLYYGLNQYLHEVDDRFPLTELTEGDITLRHGFLGAGYAFFSPEGVEAVTMAQQDSLVLEPTYTGKTLAALVSDARSGLFSNKVVLFWNTYNSTDFSDTIKHIDYHRLPKSLHQYFEKDVQELDSDPA